MSANPQPVVCPMCEEPIEPWQPKRKLGGHQVCVGCYDEFGREIEEMFGNAAEEWGQES